jgi:hypothetical protein
VRKTLLTSHVVEIKNTTFSVGEKSIPIHLTKSKEANLTHVYFERSDLYVEVDEADCFTTINIVNTGTMAVKNNNNRILMCDGQEIFNITAIVLTDLKDSLDLIVCHDILLIVVFF